VAATVEDGFHDRRREIRGPLGELVEVGVPRIEDGGAQHPRQRRVVRAVVRGSSVSTTSAWTASTDAAPTIMSFHSRAIAISSEARKRVPCMMHS
jgi:hypothetical protein